MRTVKEIQTIINNRQTYYAKLRTQQVLENEFYELTYDAKVPKLYTKITPDTAREWINNGVKSFTLDNPRASVPPRKNAQQYRETEARLEAFYNGWLDFMSSLQPDPIKLNAMLILLRGECYFKILMDDKYYGQDTKNMGKEEKEQLEIDKLNNFPLIVKAPDPMNVYPSTIHERMIPHDVVEIYSRTVEDVLDSCQRNKWHWDNPNGLKDDDEVIWAEWWDAKERCFMVGSSIGSLESVLKPAVQTNIYDFCPYVHAYSLYGVTDSKGRPEYMTRGILYGKLDLIKLFTRAISQYDSLIVKYAWPHRQLRGNTDKVKKFLKDVVKLQLSPDDILVLPEGVELVESQGQVPPTALFNWIQTVSSMVEGPPILNAEVPPGITAGYSMNILSSAGKAMYKAPFKSLENALGVLMGLGARLIEDIIQEPVGIKTIKTTENGKIYGEEVLKPEDIKKYYICDVALLSDAPEAMDVRSTQGKGLQLARVISHRTDLIKYQGMSAQEADDEIAQVNAEEILKSDPNLRQAIGVDALKRLGFEQTSENIGLAQQVGIKQAKASVGLPVMKGRNLVEQQLPKELAAEEAARKALIS